MYKEEVYIIQLSKAFGVGFKTPTAEPSRPKLRLGVASTEGTSLSTSTHPSLDIIPSYLYRYLFFWIWVPLVQRTLDDYSAYWNSHVIRRQSLKNAPTGVSPNMLAQLPSLYDTDAQDCSVSIDPQRVEEERARLGGTSMRDDRFR